jgi:hypothetical protein
VVDGYHFWRVLDDAFLFFFFFFCVAVEADEGSESRATVASALLSSSR